MSDRAQECFGHGQEWNATETNVTAEFVVMVLAIAVFVADDTVGGVTQE